MTPMQRMAISHVEKIALAYNGRGLNAASRANPFEHCIATSLTTGGQAQLAMAIVIVVSTGNE